MNKPPLTSPKIKKKTCDSIKTYPVTQIRFYLGNRFEECLTIKITVQGEQILETIKTKPPTRQW